MYEEVGPWLLNLQNRLTGQDVEEFSNFPDLTQVFQMTKRKEKLRRKIDDDFQSLPPSVLQAGLFFFSPS